MVRMGILRIGRLDPVISLLRQDHRRLFQCLFDLGTVRDPAFLAEREPLPGKVAPVVDQPDAVRVQIFPRPIERRHLAIVLVLCGNILPGIVTQSISIPGIRTPPT